MIWWFPLHRSGRVVPKFLLIMPLNSCKTLKWQFYLFKRNTRHRKISYIIPKQYFLLFLLFKFNQTVVINYLFMFYPIVSKNWILFAYCSPFFYICAFIYMHSSFYTHAWLPCNVVFFYLLSLIVLSSDIDIFFII